MSVPDTAIQNAAGDPAPGVQRRKLSASAYDQVASGLLSALIFVGTVVGCLLMLFFSSKLVVKQKAVPVEMAQIGGREEGTTRGTARDLGEPGSEDVPPDLVTEQIQPSLEAVSTAVTSRAAMLDDAALETGFVMGHGKGRGDSRDVGKGSGTVAEQVPRAQRWSIHFDGGNLKTYAKQLDFFGIELAAVGGDDNLVHYAFNLAKAKPDTRTGAPDAEGRLYMTWRSGPLQDADKELLKRAGVATNGRVVLQFYPSEVETTLAQLELEYAKGHKVNEIRRTTFDVRSEGDAFKFIVTAQQLF